MGNLVGQDLGHYHLKRLLGQGGFAEVYLAEHLHLGTDAAIKVLRTHLGSAQEIEAFRTEARTIARLKHPNVIRVSDFGLQEGIPYLVMDYASAGTLRHRHPKGSRIELATIVSYVNQVASALQYAHERKLIHRDVKPENMLLSEQGEVLLSDFGIAIVAQSSRYDHTQDTVGTISYMAPEQIQAHPRPASDQYALGVVVYEWLSGEPPFMGTFTEIAAKHCLTPPPPLRQRVPEISPMLEQVVLTALAKDPKERFGSVLAFATALVQAGIIKPAPLRPAPASLPVLPMKSSPPRIEKRVKPQNEEVLPVPWDSAGMRPAPLAVPPPTRRGTRLSLFRGHSASVNAVAWSPNGRRIASGSDDNTAQVWNFVYGSQPSLYTGHFYAVNAVAWSPDGLHIASGSDDGTVQVWNATDGSQPSLYIDHSDIVYSVAWSPDGKRIASGSDDGTVQVWNGSQAFTYKGHSASVNAVAWSPDGLRIASGSVDNTVQVWNATDGSQFSPYTGHSGGVLAVAWSPDGKQIASGAFDRTVRVWNVADGSQASTYKGHSASVNAVAWSPDGLRIASGSVDKTVQVWNAADGSQAYTYKGHSASVNAVAWSPNGKCIASGSDDNTIQVWAS
ncbi:MAG TPA: serine/threonine-protein kinase [Ktedonosporobacter sp.]|nr:serine/threonine-protein kinase [Ktedonosporobacter sp.]